MADPGRPGSLRTVYLGQFEHGHGERICASLEEAGIAWTYKQAGGLTQFFFAGEWGYRLFVDASRLEEARGIVAATEKGTPPPESN